MLNVKLFTVLLLAAGLVRAQESAPASRFAQGGADDNMSAAYWKLWNPEVQKKIDADIDKHRKADALLWIEDLEASGSVHIEQVAHDFVFGASIFNFDQLGTDQRNARYKALFGQLFNSATLPFYWKKFEMEPGRPRFAGEYWDTAKFWNSVADPKSQPHWRRPAPDPILAYYKDKGVRMHGHTLTWGNARWQHPEWLMEEFCSKEEKERLEKYSAEELSKLPAAQVAAMAPRYAAELKSRYERRIQEIAEYYGDVLPSWDVVNESAVDFRGNSTSGETISPSQYKVLLPGDYTYHSFKIAEEVFPKNVLLNINDYANNQNYVNQVIDLRKKGAKIDILGSQMHLFNPQLCQDIAAGKAIESPEKVSRKMNLFSQANLPIHLSEITITAPSDNEEGRAVQGVIAYNLYRLWFSVEKMMGITWWNIVDDCGAPGEPTTSGIFTRNMEPKPAYFALNELINETWKTQMKVKHTPAEPLRFRGFKGTYRVTWKNQAGESIEKVFELRKDGDGFNLNKK